MKSVTIVAACVMIRGSWNPAHNSLSREHSERAALESVLTSKRKLFALFLEAVQRMSILFGGVNLDDPFHPWKYCQELYTSHIIPMRPMETGKWEKCAFILNLCISDCLCKIGRSCSGSWQVRPYIYDHLTARPSKLWRPDWPSFILPSPPLLSIRLIIPYTTPDLYFVVNTLCSLFQHYSIPHTNHRPLPPNLVD